MDRQTALAFAAGAATVAVVGALAGMTTKSTSQLEEELKVRSATSLWDVG
jgi:hypothetical protein